MSGDWTSDEVGWMCLGFALIGFGLGILFWLLVTL